MKAVFSSLLIAVSVFVCADISKHFKKADNKSDVHTLRNIDFIYLINLDKRPQRLQNCLSQLHPYGINPYRFSAVNGYTFTLDELNEMGVTLAPGMKTGDKGYCYYIGPDGHPQAREEIMNTYGKTYFAANLGGIGCILSHLSVLQDAYDSNYETIWVFEDDFEVIRDPRVIPELIDDLDRLVGKDNWDVLFTDVDRRDEQGRYQVVRSAPYPCRPNYSPPQAERFRYKLRVRSPSKEKRRGKIQFIQVGARFGLHSMIVRRSGMKKILDFIKTLGIFLPIDTDLYQVEGIRLFSLNKDIISNAIDAKTDALNAWDLIEAQR